MPSASPLVGVIGGSGLYKLGLNVIKEINIAKEVPDWPFGPTSSPVTIAQLETGQTIAFIARHGVGHSLLPTEVPCKSNIAALKHLGVEAIVAFSAVGSLREDIKPRDVVIPSQIIDRTKARPEPGERPATYFGGGIVAHAMFGDPFDNQLNAIIGPMIKDVVKKNKLEGVDVHTDKTVVCMEGPAFSTRAESKMYRQLGGDIINMSVLPEAKLAREAELSYVLVCTATDYDAWRESEDSVTVAEVIKVLHDNAAASDLIAQEVLGDISDMVAAGTKLTQAKGAMQYGVVTKQNHWPDAKRKELSFVLPYFK